MRILIVNGSSQGGYAEVGKSINRMLSNQHEIYNLNDFEGKTKDRQLDNAEASIENIDIVITIQNIWDLEWLTKRDRTWSWYMYCPVEGMEIPSHVTNRTGQKVDIVKIINSPDVLIAYNKFGYNELSKIRKPDIQIEHAVNPIYKFDPELKKQAINATGNKLTFGFVGLNIPRKGIDTLIDSWMKIKSLSEKISNRECQLLIHTKDTPLSPPIKDLITTHRAQNVIVNNNQLSEDEMVELYHTIDIFISLHNAEGFGLPIIEASSCGCSIISNNYAGPADIVETIKTERNDDLELNPPLYVIPPSAITQDVHIPWIRRYPNLEYLSQSFLRYVIGRINDPELSLYTHQVINSIYGEDRIVNLWNAIIMRTKEQTPIRLVSL